MAELTGILEEAARRYSANRAEAVCLVVEGSRAQDPEARAAADALASAAEAMVCDFIATTHPGAARRVTDYLATQLVGLSTKARQGHGLDRLLATARLASLAFPAALAEEPPAAEG